MKNYLLAIALAAGTSLFAAAPQATTPDTGSQAPAKTTKARKTRKHSKKHTTNTNKAMAPASGSSAAPSTK